MPSSSTRSTKTCLKCSLSKYVRLQSTFLFLFRTLADSLLAFLTQLELTVVECSYFPLLLLLDQHENLPFPCAGSEGRLGMADAISLLSGISGLSFDYPFLSPLSFLSNSRLALFCLGISGLSFDYPILSPLSFLSYSRLAFFFFFFFFFFLSCHFCAAGPTSWPCFLRKILQHFSLRNRIFGMALLEQLVDDSW